MNKLNETQFKHRYSHQLSAKGTKQVAIGTKLNRKNLDKLVRSAVEKDMYNTVNKYKDIQLDELNKQAFVDPNK